MLAGIKNIVRKIYDNGKRLEVIERNQKELTALHWENYWANIFNTSTTQSTWYKGVSLNVGRWAPGYALFYVLYRILDEIKPANILELGMGETTKMIRKYKEILNPKAFCVTVEHDANWIELKKKNGLSGDAINIVNPGLTEAAVKGKNTTQYKDLTEYLEPFSRQFNLILIDGPFGSDSYSRYNIIGLIEQGYLDKDFIVIMDDYNREGEKETIEDVKNILKKRGTEFVGTSYRGDKEFYILASSEKKYLTSL